VGVGVEFIGATAGQGTEEHRVTVAGNDRIDVDVHTEGATLLAARTVAVADEDGLAVEAEAALCRGQDVGGPAPAVVDTTAGGVVIEDSIGLGAAHVRSGLREAGTTHVERNISPVVEAVADTVLVGGRRVAI